MSKMPLVPKAPVVKVIAVIINSHEVSKLLECLKRNHALPFEKVVTKSSRSVPYSVSQDMMIFQDEVHLFYSPKDVRSLLVSQFS
jgi:hypothetical protein